MFKALPKTPYNPVTDVNILRAPDNSGWQVLGAHPRFFPDNLYEDSMNNSYMQAVAYSASMVSNSKRAWDTNRNFVLIEKLDRKKVNRLYVRITRPTGGYKTFEVIKTEHGPFCGAGFEDVRKAVTEAVMWFLDERKRTEDVILKKNIDSKVKRKEARRSYLFGEFIP